MACDNRGDGELFAVGGELHANGGDKRSIFHLFHFRLALVDRGVIQSG
jgi:hypothetical protein